MTLLLQARDDIALLIGHDLSDDPVDADLFGDPTGCGLIISGQKDWLDVEFFQTFDRFGRARLYRVAQNEDSQGLRALKGCREDTLLRFSFFFAVLVETWGCGDEFTGLVTFKDRAGVTGLVDDPFKFFIRML